MSFLDNLENNLKALESREEKDPEKLKRDQEKREADRAAALQAAPFAEALKSGAFTNTLLRECRTIGHAMRMMVRFTWIDTVLRLEAKDMRLELRPTPTGVEAVYLVNGAEQSREAVDLNGDAAALARKWLAGNGTAA